MANTLQKTPTTASEVIQQIKQILVEGLQVNVRLDEIPDDYSLLEDGLALDSILIAELIVLIENRFGVKFDDRALEVELFDNLSRLAAFVDEACQAARSHDEAREAGGLPC